jgi:predicted dehydrogenase
VLSEKPMVCTVADAHQLIKTIERTGKTFGISYQRHSEPGWRWIKQQIDTGAVGTVEYVAVFLTQGWLQGTRGTWRQNLALSGGGQLNDSGSHMLDVMLWITGLEADVVSATTENFDAEVDINTGAWVKFTNGARGTITVIGNAPVWWEDVTIVGSKGSVYLRQGRLFWAPNGAERPEEVAKEALPAGSDPDKNWVEAIAYGKPIDAPATCGLRVIELTEAAWKSAASGKPVKVVRG